jgi:hypothetical protein
VFYGKQAATLCSNSSELGKTEGIITIRRRRRSSRRRSRRRRRGMIHRYRLSFHLVEEMNIILLFSPSTILFLNR